jgi:restriction system protein
MEPWRQYQEDTAGFLRGLGLDAEVDATIVGPRTSHDVDVAVRANLLGFDLLWIVECKHWKSAISKVHVMALRQIVQDVGADRGILMAESGFQSGAVEAAQLTNVQLTSLKDLAVTAAPAIAFAQLRVLQERVDDCRERYWAIPKRDRIEQGLRGDVGEYAYSGARMIVAIEAQLNEAFRGRFPTRPDDGSALLRAGVAEPQDSPGALFAHLEPYVRDLEDRLTRAEATLRD